ncbi:hypothetical protein CC86DRAFT_280864, partial [Ophiobolus disseminans]
WRTSFWGCFCPFKLCALTCFLPCITFGRTDYRLQHRGDMTKYEPVNTACMLWYLAACFGCDCIPTTILLEEMRDEHNLKGSCCVDFLKACCCGCCALMQAEKESKLIYSGERVCMDGVVDEQYAGGAAAGAEMVYAPASGQVEQEEVTEAPQPTASSVDVIVEEPSVVEGSMTVLLLRMQNRWCARRRPTRSSTRKRQTRRSRRAAAWRPMSRS